MTGPILVPVVTFVFLIKIAIDVGDRIVQGRKDSIDHIFVLRIGLLIIAVDLLDRVVQRFNGSLDPFFRFTAIVGCASRQQT
jgi:hypothetical protein